MAVQLISVIDGPDGKEMFKIHEEGVEVLEKVNLKFGVVSSIGLPKSGKSSLLNILID